MKKIIIAIDGFSACGKSSTAKKIAQALNYSYIDSGAMYRAVALYFLDHHINLGNSKSVDKVLNQIEITFIYNKETNQSDIYLNGLNVEHKIRTMEISECVSEVAAIKSVRVAMVKLQQKMGHSKALVMDGRDIGSVVFPCADLKIFMNADFDVRAERRQKELSDKNNLMNLEAVKANLRKRDQLDSTRQESPLIRAEGSYNVDTTYMYLEEQVEHIIQVAIGKMSKE